MFYTLKNDRYVINRVFRFFIELFHRISFEKGQKYCCENCIKSSWRSETFSQRNLWIYFNQYVRRILNPIFLPRNLHFICKYAYFVVKRFVVLWKRFLFFRQVWNKMVISSWDSFVLKNFFEFLEQLDWNLKTLTLNIKLNVHFHLLIQPFPDR